MFEFEKLVHQYEKLTYDERREQLTVLSAIILPAIDAITGGVEAFTTIVLASCAADGKLDIEEYSLFKDSTNIDISFEDASALVEAAKKDNIGERADNVADVLGMISEDIKVAVVSYCLCLVSADNYVGIRESQFIKKLIK